MKALLRAIPDVVRLITRLVTDPALPRAAKVALGAVAVYLLSPIDLLPDFVPLVGYLDDLLLVHVRRLPEKTLGELRRELLKETEELLQRFEPSVFTVPISGLCAALFRSHRDLLVSCGAPLPTSARGACTPWGIPVRPQGVLPAASRCATISR